MIVQNLKTSPNIDKDNTKLTDLKIKMLTPYEKVNEYPNTKKLKK